MWLLLVGQFEDGDPVPDAVRATIEGDKRIVTVPWLDHTGIAYRAMDVLAFPSYREGLPNVPLEAQLCGVPVVGYAATGTVDAVAPGSGLVTVGDVTALGRTDSRSSHRRHRPIFKQASRNPLGGGELRSGPTVVRTRRSIPRMDPDVVMTARLDDRPKRGWSKQSERWTDEKHSRR